MINICETLTATQETTDKRQDHEDDRHPKKDARPFGRCTGHPAEAEEGSNESYDQKDDGPVEKITHDFLVSYRSGSAMLGNHAPPPLFRTTPPRKEQIALRNS
jgi:hypothetical protein